MAPAETGKPHPGPTITPRARPACWSWRGTTARRPSPAGLLLLTFAGEEIGLLGSGHYVRNPLLPIEKAVAMINLDMIGRIAKAR